MILVLIVVLIYIIFINLKIYKVKISFCFVFTVDFSHLTTVSIHCPCHFNHEAEVVFNTSHVCYGFLDMLSTGRYSLLCHYTIVTRTAAL